MLSITRVARTKVAVAAAVVALAAAGSFVAPKTTSAALPDLSIQRITVNNATKGVTVRLHNNTAATGLGFYTTIYVCNSATWVCTTAHRYTPAMGANADALATVTGFSGANYAYACTDYYSGVPVLTNRVAESNEGNNCRSETFAAIP